jgi:hypothetical protein
VLKKNISDGVESQNGSNGTPLNPPLFWLDNIFNVNVYGARSLESLVGEHHLFGSQFVEIPRIFF